MVILFLGAPGSGKDTQAEILADKHGFKVVSTGTVMREEIARGTELGRQAEEISSAGHWLPDEMMYGLLEEHLKRNNYPKIIFTGAVRRVTQIPMLDALLSRLGLELSKVIYFELSDEQVMERLSHRWFCPLDSETYDYKNKPPKVAGKCDECGSDLIQRPDDTPEGIRGRLAEMAQTVGPILEEYTKEGRLVRVDASPSIDEIAANLETVLIKDLTQ